MSAAVIVPALRRRKSNRRNRTTGGQQNEAEATAKRSEPLARCWDCFFPKEKGVDASMNAPVSFHLRLQLGPNFTHNSISSVQFLRLPFLKSFPNADSHGLEKSEAEALAKAAGTRYEVFIRRVKHVPILMPGEKKSIHGSEHGASPKSLDPEHHAEHTPPELGFKELLIITEKRLYIVSGNTGQNNEDDKIMKEAGASGFWASSYQLEIVESIPLEQVDTVSMWKNDEATDVNASDHQPRSLKSLSESLYGCLDLIAKCLNQQTAEVNDPGTTSDDSFLSKFSDELEDPSFEGGLKITTKKDGFHGGRPFYFMVKKDSWKSTMRPQKSNEKDQDASTNARHLHTVCRKLEVLADIRKTIYSHEHRFQLLQETLQAMWDSIPFNISVLLLIVSNFVFTVLQLENKDPSQQPFYETVDLVYTTFFCAGNAPCLPPHQHLLHVFRTLFWIERI